MAVKAQKIRAEFGAWEPDAAILDGRQATEARNCTPSKRGYKSFPTLTPALRNGTPLAERCKAAISVKDLDSSLYTAAATQGGIYSLERGESGYVWELKTAGAAAGSARDFTEYGSGIYAIFGNKLLKSQINGGIGTFEQVEGAPFAEVIGVVRDFLMVGRLSGHANGIQWSGIDQPDLWPEPGSNLAQYEQSDRQIFPVGGRVQTIVGGMGGVDGLIFMESAIYRATYIGTPYVFQFDPVDRERGTVAEHSPVVCGNTCVYISEDGWRITDGASVKNIGAERVDSWFFHECDPARLGEVRGVHDAEKRLAMWCFPTVNAPDGVCDRILVYNYTVDKWSYIVESVETLFHDHARGIVLEDLNAYGSLEEQPFASLDLGQFKTGNKGVSAFSAGHVYSRFGGATMEAVIDTAEIGGDRMLIHGLRPLVDRGDAQALPIYRSRQQDFTRYGDYSPQERDGVCYCHVSTVYAGARVKIPAGGVWRNAVGVEMLAEQEGGM